MRNRRRSQSMQLAVETAEVLETRTLLSATAMGSLASMTAMTHTSVVSHLAATPNFNVSTVPNNGDLNPYGVAFVPQVVVGGGKLHAGDILVSNFNNSSNLQGTGSTIVSISPTGQQSLFFQGPSGIGLTTALGVLRSGFVLVGNVPTADGSFSTIKPGSLMILDKNGHLVANLTDKVKLDGPWDLTVVDEGNFAFVFVSNVLNGTVTRLDLFTPRFSDDVDVLSMTTIASGYGHRGDPTNLVIGPTGLAFDSVHDKLFVASTLDNTIFSIPNALFRQSSAGTGSVVFQDPHLRGPLGLVLLPNGNLIAANGDSVNGDPTQSSELVEFTPTGHFVGQTSIDPGQDGAFGIAINVHGDDVSFAAVDDNTNTLQVWDFEI
jgi:hypothetical protein